MLKQPSAIDEVAFPPVSTGAAADGEPPPSANRFDWERAFRARSAKEGMKRSAQLVGFILATYVNADGTEARPSAETVAAAAGYAKAKTVYGALAELRNSGWVHQDEQGSGGSGMASVYRLTIPGPCIPEE